MHLEKVTSQSNEAAIAGWISSNDATLFTMVLVVVIAIFLHTKLSKGERENVMLQGEHDTLAESLAAATSQLDTTKDALKSSGQQLAQTQEERDQLRQQLAEKLDRIAQLITKLDSAIAETGRLESQRDSLAAAKDSLAHQSTSLEAERSSLRSANTAISEKLEQISRQLAEKLAALSEVEKQRDRLKEQADKLEAIITRLEQANIKLAGSHNQAAAARAAAEIRAEELATQLAADNKKAEDYLAQLKRSTALLERLNSEKKALQTSLTQVEQQRQTDLREEVRHSRELVGLAGRLERVAILFDASGSMNQAAAGGEGDRWAEAQDIAATWLNHLRVEQCVVIVFSSDVRTFPADGSLADVRGDHGNANRASLLQQLRAVKPAGMTNTLAALRKAYEYDIDTILLFSDGAPSMVDTGHFDPAIAQQIYDLCRKHPGIPINTMGLGNYFDKDMSSFLRTVAKISGGTFRGK